MQNMTFLRLKANKLEWYHFGCYGNLLTIAKSYVVYAYHLKDISSQIISQWGSIHKSY